MSLARKIVTSGYILIFILIGMIIYSYYYEWVRLEELEEQNRETNKLQEDINDFNMILSEFSLAGEGFLNWDDVDKEQYQKQHIKIDSILFHFNEMYPNEHIDSVRQLIDDKAKGLLNLADVIFKQKRTNDKITKEIPIIARTSSQEQIRKPKRKGFLGFFGEKEELSPTATSTMLQTLNRNTISQYANHNRHLSELTDSIVERNKMLNTQLNKIIRQLEDKSRNNLRCRENEISIMRERSYRQMGGLTVLLIVLLLLSYIVILWDFRQKERTRHKLEESIRQNNLLLEMRKKIILTISHDIRGPLNIIGGSAELALDTREKKKRDNYLKNVRILCSHVLHLLNNLLDMYRLNEAKETPNNIPFRLGDLMKRISTGASHIINNKGLVFEAEFKNMDVTVLGDEDRIEQIADNLLSNAVKFTHTGKVAFIVTYSNGNLDMIVRDTGIGMSENTIKRIFRPFERADNLENIDGFGLGLTITKGLVALLSGTISVSSKEGVGTEFQVTLPLELTDGCVNNSQMQKSNPMHMPHSVLVVDDDPLQLEIIKEMLERNMVSCTICKTASDVVKEMRSHDYDMILSDIQMPGTDGFALFELLRKSNIGNSRDIPIIAMTARGDCETDALLEYGFASSIFKPFSMQELLEHIANIMPHKANGEHIDFSILLLEATDKISILQSLKTSCDNDISELRKATEKHDKIKLREVIHRIYPVWEMLYMADRLEILREELKKSNTSWDIISNSVREITRIIFDIRANAHREIILLKDEEQDTDS